MSFYFLFLSFWHSYEILLLNGNEINDDTINYLKKAKLKNLHRFITEGNYKIDLNEKTKKSILVSFLYE